MSAEFPTHRLGPLFLDVWRDCDGPAETLYINVGLVFGYRSVSLAFEVAW